MPDPTYDMAAVGFLADEVVFAVDAFRTGEKPDDEGLAALRKAQALLEGLAMLDDQERVRDRPTSELRELVSTKRQALRVLSDEKDSEAVREFLMNVSRALSDLIDEDPKSAPDQPQRYSEVAHFFERLGRLSLADVRRTTEADQPAWMSSLPTGLR